MMTVRGTLLEKARELTEGDRNELYGSPTAQMSLAGELKAVLRDANSAVISARTISNAEWEAIEMLVTKLSRIVVGPVVHEDSYVDAAAYAAIAGECAITTLQQDDLRDSIMNGPGHNTYESAMPTDLKKAMEEPYLPSGRWFDKFTGGAR